jgi:hypothetical protein
MALSLPQALRGRKVQSEWQRSIWMSETGVYCRCSRGNVGRPAGQASVSAAAGGGAGWAPLLTSSRPVEQAQLQREWGASTAVLKLPSSSYSSISPVRIRRA